jgi:hypothetical protein
VIAAVRQILGDRGTVTEALREVACSAVQIAWAMKARDGWNPRLEAGGNFESPITRATERVDLQIDGLRLALNLAPLIATGGPGATSPRLSITRFIRL